MAPWPPIIAAGGDFRAYTIIGVIVDASIIEMPFHDVIPQRLRCAFIHQPYERSKIHSVRISHSWSLAFDIFIRSSLLKYCMSGCHMPKSTLSSPAAILYQNIHRLKCITRGHHFPESGFTWPVPGKCFHEICDKTVLVCQWRPVSFHSTRPARSHFNICFAPNNKKHRRSLRHDISRGRASRDDAVDGIIDRWYIVEVYRVAAAGTASGMMMPRL